MPESAIELTPPASTLQSRRRTIMEQGRVTHIDGTKVMVGMSKALRPNHNAVCKIIAQLLRCMTEEQLAAYVGSTKHSVKKWLAGIENPQLAAIRVMWILWSIRFKRENLDTWISILTWGHMKGLKDDIPLERRMVPDPPATQEQLTPGCFDPLTVSEGSSTIPESCDSQSPAFPPSESC